MSDAVADFIRDAVSDPDYFYDERYADMEHHLNKENEDVNTSDNKPSPADLAKKFKAVGEAAQNVGSAMKKIAESGKPAEAKKPFERPEHLMHRPFQNSEALRGLQSSLHRKDNKANNPRAKRQR